MHMVHTLSNSKVEHLTSSYSHLGSLPSLMDQQREGLQMEQLKSILRLQYVFKFKTYTEITKSKCPTNSDVSFFLVNYWIFSLCGEKPLHWVLGWVDFTGKEYAIFDGLPKLHLSTWAFSEWKAVYQSHLIHHNMTFQLLIKTVNYVHMYLKRDEIQFKKDPS